MAKRNTNKDEDRQYDNYTWRDHADIREEIGALKQAGEDRDRRINEIKNSVDDLNKKVSDLSSQIKSLLTTFKVVAWIVGIVISLAGIYFKFFK